MYNTSPHLDEADCVLCMISFSQQSYERMHCYHSQPVGAATQVQRCGATPPGWHSPVAGGEPAWEWGGLAANLCPQTVLCSAASPEPCGLLPSSLLLPPSPASKRGMSLPPSSACSTLNRLIYHIKNEVASGCLDAALLHFQREAVLMSVLSKCFTSLSTGEEFWYLLRLVGGSHPAPSRRQETVLERLTQLSAPPGQLMVSLGGQQGPGDFLRQRQLVQG